MVCTLCSPPICNVYWKRPIILLTKKLRPMQTPKRRHKNSNNNFGQCRVLFDFGGMIIGSRISRRIVGATVLRKFFDELAKASRIGIHRVDNIHPVSVWLCFHPHEIWCPKADTCLLWSQDWWRLKTFNCYRSFGTTHSISEQLRIIKG